MSTLRPLLFLLLAFGCAQGRLKTHDKGASILQLATSETAVEFNVLLPRGRDAQFSVMTPTGVELAANQTKVQEHPKSDWVIHQVHFQALPALAQDFQFIVKSQGQTLDQRVFRLFSNKGERLSFVVGSCMSAHFPQEQAAMWEAVASAAPEWLLLIGDNAYVVQDQNPITDGVVLWDRMVDHRRSLDLYRWKKLIPTHAVWDDNDYGQRDGNQDFALKEESQRIFRAFFLPAFPHEQLALGPGVASRLELRGMHFSFLDNRSFRDPSGEGEHFGQQQEAWLFERLKSAQLPTWIISGDQFFGGYHQFESYEGGHPRAFENFLTQLKGISTPFVFLSGDRHLTEVMQFPRALLGQRSFELTSSPFHSKTYPGTIEASANPWRVVGRDGVNNFMWIETWLEETSWNIRLTSRDQTGAVLFQRDLSLTTEALKDFTIEKRQKRRKYRRARWRRR